jgi:hypothetical protein
MPVGAAESIGYGNLDYMRRTGNLPPNGGGSGPMHMTGTLVLDSGQIMGTFTGIAQSVAQSAISGANRDAKYRRPGV